MQAISILTDIALKGCFILAVAACGVRLMPRASATTRHMVWLLAMVGVLVLPVLSLFLPAWRVLPNWADASAAGVADDVTRPSAFVTGDENSTPAPIAAAAPPRAYEAQHRAATPPAIPNLKSEITNQPWTRSDWLLAAWRAGATLCLLPILVGWLSLWRLSRRAQRVTDPAWLDLLWRCQRQLGMRRRVVFLQSRERAMPMTWGIFRPRLLLPGEMLGSRGLPPAAEIETVLLHELSHIQRHDCLAQLLAQLVAAMHWFNPLTWYAAHRMAVERERACDDRVLTAGAAPADYAQQLLNIATHLQSHPLATYNAIAMARPSKLEGRLLAILDGKRNRRTITSLNIIASLLVLISIVVPISMLQAEVVSEKVSGIFKPAINFGPEIERMVAERGENFIDLDSNQAFTRHSGAESADFPAWTQSHGIDLSTAKVALWGRGIGAYDMVAAPLRGEVWKTMTAPQLVEKLNDVQRISNRFMNIGTTHAFKTREGGMGVLQIVGFSDEPKGVKIRYKLVKDATSGDASSGTATITANNGRVRIEEGGRVVEAERFELQAPKAAVVDTGAPSTNGTDLQGLIDAAKPSAVVNVPAGDYFQPLKITKPITLRGAGVDKTFIEVDSAEHAIHLVKAGKVVLENLTVRWAMPGGAKPQAAVAAIVSQETDLTIRNCRVQPIHPGLPPAALLASGKSLVQIENSRFEGFEFTVNFSEGAHARIEHSEFYNAGHCAITVHGPASAAVHRNVIAGSNYHGVRSSGGVLNLQLNLIADNRVSGVYLGNKNAQASIQGNLFHGNGSGVWSLYGSEFGPLQGNLFVGNREFGVIAWDSCEGMVQGNSFVENGTAIQRQPNGKGLPVTGLFRADVNHFWKNTKDAQGCEAEASITGDPLFVDAAKGDFTLQSGSPLLHRSNPKLNRGLIDPAEMAWLWRKWKGGNEEVGE